MGNLFTSPTATGPPPRMDSCTVCGKSYDVDRQKDEVCRVVHPAGAFNYGRRTCACCMDPPQARVRKYNRMETDLKNATRSCASKTCMETVVVMPCAMILTHSCKHGPLGPGMPRQDPLWVRCVTSKYGIFFCFPVFLIISPIAIVVMLLIDLVRFLCTPCRRKCPISDDACTACCCCPCITAIRCTRCTSLLIDPVDPEAQWPCCHDPNPDAVGCKGEKHQPTNDWDSFHSAADDDDFVLIVFRELSGTATPVSLHRNLTILEIRKHLHTRFEVPLETIRLLHIITPLDDSKTLADYSFQNGTSINIVLRALRPPAGVAGAVAGGVGGVTANESVV